LTVAVRGGWRDEVPLVVVVVVVQLLADVQLVVVELDAVPSVTVTVPLKLLVPDTALARELNIVIARPAAADEVNPSPGMGEYAGGFPESVTVESATVSAIASSLALRRVALV
jgi:hypothetical protein